MQTFRVGVLGATGIVGQQFITLLQDHPWFEISALAASDKSSGKPYGEAVHWVQDSPLPASVAEMPVLPAKPDLPCDLVFSALGASAAETIESAFAEAGYPVVSNASAFRMDPVVPLLIPEINPDHVDLIEKQHTRGEDKRGGFIVTNPNCSTIGLVLGIYPIWKRFGIRRMVVTTVQAVSGAGYPGLAALQIMGNVIPNISGEQEKIENEPLKILGKLVQGRIQPARMQISAQCNRVPVRDGHLVSVSLELETKAAVEDVREALETFVSPLAEYELPSAPKHPVVFLDDPFRPQPLKDLRTAGGMSVTVGQLAPCPVLHYRLVSLVHNTIRGAAGAAILNAEWLAVSGYLQKRDA